MEVLFDGKPEADEALKVTIEQLEADRKKTRERLVLPPDPAEAGKLAARYRSEALGTLDIRHQGKAVSFDIGEWKSDVASRKHDDGSISYITVAPTLQGFEFVVGSKDGKRSLIMRDAQHEYVFVES